MKANETRAGESDSAVGGVTQVEARLTLGLWKRMSSMRKEVVEREGEALSSRPESRFSRSSSMPAVAACWLPMAPASLWMFLSWFLRLLQLLGSCWR